MNTPFFSVVMAIIRKDLQAELRSRELVATMLLFALLSVLAFSFALELDRLAREEVVSGVLWVTVIFASLLGLNRSMSIERENDSIDAMLLTPIPRSAIFVGKLVGNYLFTATVGIALLPLMTILYNINMLNLWVIATLLLGTLGICITGTLLAAMTVQTRAREALLPIVMLPVVLPILLAAVKATTGIINNAPVSDWQTWPQVLLIVDIIYLVLCLLMFSYVIEE
ncbi:MAG: heme exporter protein CcmB [Anaerolineae bacterium]|nr:heme exporter protein CcmB [Anaerolineae bacterium]